MKFLKKSMLFLGAIAMIGLVGCGETPKTPLYSANFNSGNSEVFGIYGTVQDNDDGTITLKRNGEQNYSASTYFGENTNKNFAWNEGGMSVEVKVKVDSESITNGKYSVWSLALNGQNGKYLTELPVFFIGTESGIKFVYKFTGVDADYNTLANDTTATTLNNGYYTFAYNFNTQENGDVKVAVTLKNNSGNNIYSSTAETFTVIDNSEVTAGTTVKEEMIKGLRYLWLVRTNVDVTVDNLAIYAK